MKDIVPNNVVSLQAHRDDLAAKAKARKDVHESFEENSLGLEEGFTLLEAATQLKEKPSNLIEWMHWHRWLYRKGGR